MNSPFVANFWYFDTGAKRVSLAVPWVPTMSYTKVNYEETESTQGLHFLRDPLGCEDHGVSVLDAEPNWDGFEHDHADEGEEEVYVLVDGAATITVDDEDVAMDVGDAVRVSPGTTRRITTGDEGAQFVITGAP